MNQVFQYTQTIHDAVTNAKCIMIIDNNTMTAGDIGHWFNGSVTIDIELRDSSYEWIPGVAPASVYDKFNRAKYDFKVDNPSYPNSVSLTIPSSATTAYTGNFVINVQKYVRPGFTVTTAVVANLNNQHCTLKVNNAVVAAGVIIYSADTVTLTANTGYRFKTDASGNASVYFAHINEHLYATLNGDHTIATIHMRMPTNETRNFWESLAVVTEVMPAADVTSFVIAGLDLKNDPYADKVKINGIDAVMGQTVHAGNVITINTLPGYRWSDNRNIPFPQLVYNDVNGKEQYFAFTKSADKTIATITVPTLTGGAKWSTGDYRIGMNTEVIPVVSGDVTSYTITMLDLSTLSSNTQTSTLNGAPLKIGDVIHSGDTIITTANRGYYFATAASMVKIDSSGNEHDVTVGIISPNKLSQVITLPTLHSPEKWRVNPSKQTISAYADFAPRVTSYTFTKADYDLLALHSVALMRNNIRLNAGDIIHKGDVISAKITTTGWEFYNTPTNYNVLSLVHNDSISNLGWVTTDVDRTITNSVTFPELMFGKSWEPFNAANIHTREIPFTRSTWLNIYAVTESQLNDLKFALALAQVNNSSTSGTQPKIDYSNYVKGLIELPYEIPAYERLKDTDIHIWGFSTGVDAKMFQDGILRYDLGTISVPKPDIPTLGYHATAKVFLPRFSPIELDINEVFGYTIRIEYLVNLVDGMVTCNIYSDNPNTRNGAIISETVNWGVSVPWERTEWNNITGTEIPLSGENNIVTPYIEIEIQETIQSNIFTVPILTNEKFNPAVKGYYEVEQVKFLGRNNFASAADRDDYIAALKDGFIIE